MPRSTTGGREVVPTLIDSVQDRDGHDGVAADRRSTARAATIRPRRRDLIDDRKQIADPAQRLPA